MSVSVNVAAVDIGTNSVRLLVTGPDGTELDRRMRITRLGQGVDETGRLAPAAVERTLDVLKEYAAAIAVHAVGAGRVRATATSAARDASNAAEFSAQAASALGVEPRVIGGEEEAALSFAGATADLDPAGGPFLVVDIGGGSTEIVLGTTTPEALVSIDVGCVRVSERFLHSDPASPEELAAATEAVDTMLAKAAAAVPTRRARCLVGLAGTVTTLAALAAGCEAYDPARTHHLRMGLEEVEALTAGLATDTTGGRRGRLLEPARADVIVGGALVLVRIMRQFDFESVVVSEHDILDGLAASVRSGWRA